MSIFKKNKLRVLMAAAEVAPLAKVGGLADVVGSLPMALNKLDLDVRVIMPKYGSVDEQKHGLKKIVSGVEVPVGEKTASINIWLTTKAIKGVKVYLIEDLKMFGANKVYHGNNSERFLFFSLAVLHALPAINFEPQIIHCHDFHTAMITDLLKVSNNYSGYLKDVKTLYTIHNLNYQGQNQTEVLNIANLKADMLPALSKDARDGDVNFMVQGIINADWVNTVSPTYAKEITHSVYGASLEKVIRQNSDKLSGILNGIDVAAYDPAKDKSIGKKFSSFSMKKKGDNKIYLQKKLGMEVNRNAALVGLVSRFAWQKGLELLSEKIIKESNCQFVFLGKGDKKYEDAFRLLAEKYPGRVGVKIEFNEALARQIYAAADIFLMPSRYEPCGLGQMIAMRYGALPVVRNTGGLKDTVDNKVGFKFNDFKADEMKKALNKALNTYFNKPEVWKKMMKEAMNRDFSWKTSAAEYAKLYKKILD